MPELPEVETVVRQLKRHVLGQVVKRLVVLDSKLKCFAPSALRSTLVQKVYRDGKQIVFHLKSEDGQSLYLWVHLRMTGQLLWFEQAPSVQAHERARLTLSKGVIVFADMRRFGTMKLSKDDKQYTAKGVDPLSRSFTQAKLSSLMARSATPIKPWLLRQDCLVGLGNIYACEALFIAHISPLRPAKEIKSEEAKRLHNAIKKVLKQALQFGGTTFINFANAEGGSGEFAKRLLVYGKEGQSCTLCGTTIERVVQQGRSTHFCPTCQQ